MARDTTVPDRDSELPLVFPVAIPTTDRIKDCPDKAKKDEWIAKREEKKNEKASPATSKHTSSSSSKTEYASVAKVNL